jgi:hypothetical protein
MTGDDRGSALMEALVSAAIVAGVLAAAFQVAAEASRRREAIEERRTALLIAQSQLATVGAAIPSLPGDTSGADGGYSWRLHAEPSRAEGQAAPLLQVTVAVRRTGGTADLAVLRTLRVAQVQ